VGPEYSDTLLGLSPDEVLSTTRAVRRRLDFGRTVPREVVSRCIELALQAPNGSNRNQWRFIAVDDRDTVARMAGIYDAALEDYVRSLGQRVGANYVGADVPGFERIGESVQYLRENMQHVPVLVVPVFAGRPEGAGLFGQASLWGSIIQASWSFMLALRARGLGSCWTTAHLHREREMADLLGIPADHTQAGLFPVAWTLGTDFRPAWRKPVDEVLHWNGFGG
jgi:nitroreductase